MAVAATLNPVDLEVAGQARRARGRRLSALIIDLISFSILITIINNVYGVTQVTSGSPIPGLGGTAYYESATAIPWLGSVLMWLAYYIILESLFGASLGKMLLGLCVVRVDGRPLGFGAVVTRNMLRLIDALGLYLVGGISVIATTNSQRVGDRWAGTTVVLRDWTVAVNPRAIRRPAPGTGRALRLILLAALLFTIAFDYFGRPPLVIDGLFHTQYFPPGEVSSFTLGDPQWSLGTVTYHFSTRGATSASTCEGTITLEWFGLGWTESGASYTCLS
jgi:uncharacterized RDD family membrane protein YckC